MKHSLLIIVLGLAVAITSGVEAYDPVPDPRMSPGPSAQQRDGNRDYKARGSGESSSGRRTGRIEPGFGGSSRRRDSDRGYGKGYSRGNY